ncbi:MAG: putative sugar O-methyltransferase [Alphaproteobacteria bacterium]|nr:putative sugar O-methyltransferase [Alphaproteobacteria bacterium]
MPHNRIAEPTEILDAFRAARPLSQSTIDVLCWMHTALTEEAESQMSLGWRPRGGEIRKSQHVLTPDNLREFAAHTFGGIGFEGPYDFLLDPGLELPFGEPVEVTDDRLRVYRSRCKTWAKMKLDQIRDLAPEFEAHWMTLIQEACSVGGPNVYLRSESVPFPITHHGIRVGFRAPVLASWINRPISRLMEIGGGHGRFIRDAAVLMPDVKLILTDLPFNMIVSARYLIENFGHQVNLCIMPDQEFDPDSRINIIAPWRLNEISVQVDTACNFLSFQHMDETSLNWYGDAMRKLGVESLFQMNRNARRDSFDKPMDAYPFAVEFEAQKRQLIEPAMVTFPDKPGVSIEVGMLLELAHRLK